MSKRKLLLADDSVTIQKVVNLTFADEGIEVISVGDGDSAMAKVAEVSPDLIMADVNMPGLTGYEICEKIRANPSLHDTPVILLVGSFEPFDEAEAKRVGADDFLTKPFQSIRQLVNKVTILLNSGRAASQDSATGVTEGSSYLETLEIEKPTTGFTPVQTSSFQSSAFSGESSAERSAGGFSLDDAQKFDSKSEVDGSTDLLKTQPFNTEDISNLDLERNAESQFSYSRPDESPDEIGNANDYSTHRPIAEKTYYDADEDILPVDDDMPLPEAAAVLQLDDDDPLELPPIEFEFDEDDDEDDFEQTESGDANYAETPVMQETLRTFDEPIAKPISFEPITESAAAAPVISSMSSSNSGENFPPDLIDAIVQKVMERLSDKVIREVAWDVVPPMTELIVKKMAEEKLKQ